jgi:hypothetical protein
MKTYTKLISLVLVALVQMPLASAATFPGSDIVNITTFLSDDTYFNGYTELNAIDFSGEWQYTAIAHESGNLNTVSMTTGIPNSTTFATNYYNNFGEWKDIDFSSEKLFFEDSNGPYNVELDPFSTANDSFFRVFQLTADSNSLSYLGSNSLTLALGTIIVGFNDNGLSLGDADYDDIIVALQPISPVPIPASIWLFGTALLGFAGLVRKRKANRKV